MFQIKKRRETTKTNGGRFARRTVGFLLSLCLLTAGMPSALAVTYGAISDLQGLGIVDNGGMEEMRLNEPITRAEFVKMMTKLKGWDAIAPQEQRFSDVPSDHWAANYINTCKEVGLVDGVGGGLFLPDGNILLQDAMKIVVNVLGYGVNAEANSGYPMGYLAQASALGLFKNIEGNAAEQATRADVFQLTANALDVKLLEETTIGSAEYSVKKGDTLRMTLLERGDMLEGSGLVSATWDGYLFNARPGILPNEVEIDGDCYYVGATNAQEMLGMKVTFTAYEDAETGKKTLTAVNPKKNVQTMTIEAADFIDYSNNILTYSDEDGKRTEKLDVNPVPAIIYNKRPDTSGNITLRNGFIKLYDNDDDDVYDVVLVSDYVSVPMESVNTETSAIRIKDGMDYAGKWIVSAEADDGYVRSAVYNKEGEEIGVSDILPDTLVSVFESADGLYFEYRCSEDKVTGILEEIGDDYYAIDGEKYEAEVGTKLSKETPEAGDEVCAYLNFDGKIGYIEIGDSTDTKYGYIVATSANALGNSEIKLALPGAVEIIEEDPDNDPSTDNTESVLQASNSGIVVKKLATNVRIDGARGNANQIRNNTVVEYRENASGQIAEINYLSALDNESGKYYNVTDNTFGKTTGVPFGIDEKTSVICIPSGSVSSDDDYLASVKMNNGQRYEVSGYELDDSNSNVKLFTITAAMVYEDSTAIGATTKIAMVKKVSNVVNSEGTSVVKITLLTEGMEKEICGAEYANRTKLGALRIGDVIYYSQNARREMVDYNLVERLSAMGGYYTMGSGSADEKAYGKLYQVKLNRINAQKNERVHRITLQLDDLNAEVLQDYDLRISYPPAIFIYNAAEDNEVSIATIDDARMYMAFESSCDDVFIHAKNGVVQGVVLIRR